MGRKIVFARASAAVGDGLGGAVVIRLDEPWYVDDPVVKAHRAMFADEPQTVRQSTLTVIDATATGS
jgi:hypothetical protein